LPFARPDGFARRSLSGGVRPGPSSFEDCIEELPLLRESKCCNRASSAACRSNFSIGSASCAGIDLICAS
jgi:hypothetical protein